jgi:hypothetical protein
VLELSELQREGGIVNPIRTIAAAAALALSLAGADAAGAATVLHDSQGNVVVDAVPGEANRISVQTGGAGGVTLIDTAGNPLQAWDSGCAQVSDSMVECTTFSSVDLRLDDGNDHATVDIFLTGIGVFMYGEAGDDQLSAGPAGGGIDGGPGNDKLNGGDGHDAIHGGDGNDEVKGLGGSDEVYGDAGDDLVSGDSHKGPAADVVDGGAGVDRVEQDWNDLSGAPLNLTLGGGADDGRAGEGDDVRNVEKVVAFNPGTFAGTEGGDGIEVVQVSGPSTLTGGGGDDFLKTSDGADRLDGGAGADTLDGGFNDDTIVGGPGPDSLAGDHPTGECGIYWCKLPAGNDTIEARDGERDSVSCGAGTDTVNADAVDTVAGDCEQVTRGGGASGPSGGGLVVKATTARLHTALAKGLRLRVTAPGAGKINATATAKGKRVASGSRSVSRAGASSVTLKFTRKAKRSLRRAKRVQLMVTVRFAPKGGGATKKTVKVTLARSAAAAASSAYRKATFAVTVEGQQKTTWETHHVAQHDCDMNYEGGGTETIRFSSKPIRVAAHQVAPLKPTLSARHVRGAIPLRARVTRQGKLDRSAPLGSLCARGEGGGSTPRPAPDCGTKSSSKLEAELLYSYSRRNTVILQNRVSGEDLFSNCPAGGTVWPQLLTYDQQGREIGRQLPPRDLFDRSTGKHILVGGATKREQIGDTVATTRIRWEVTLTRVDRGRA